MVTVITEIQGKHTSTDTFEGLFRAHDPFQLYPAGYLALKHDGWRKVDNLQIGGIQCDPAYKAGLVQFEHE